MTRLALHILFFLSGVAALGYQLIWSKMFSTGFGHEMPAVLAIVAAFMGGMALGAAFLDRFIPRDARAGVWLAGLELTIGIWAVATSFALPHVNELALRLIGLEPGAEKHWTSSFAVPLFALLPATAAMGATLPAMEKFLSVVAPQNESVGSVYAANTFGAVTGTLLTPFLLMPALGFNKSCWVLAFANLAAAIGLFAVTRTQSRSSPDISQRKQPTPLSHRRITVLLFLTGLLGISYEVASVRVLSQVLEGTVFSYAAVLAVFLFGTAAGAAAFHRWWRTRDVSRVLPVLLYSTGMACMLGLFALMTSVLIYRQARQLGDSPLAVLAAEMLTASSVFILPAFFMGAVFSQLAQLARTGMGAVGRVVAANTLGAALAPAAAVALLPAVGVKWFLFAISFGYFLLNLPARPPNHGIVFLLLFLLTVAAGFNARLHLLIDVPRSGKILAHHDGIMASVAVLADANNHRTLRVDNRFQMGGTAAADAEYRQAHLPLLLHPAPRRALFLGVGTGISFGAASLYPNLKADGVELVPEVVDVMAAFEPQNFSPAYQPNLKLHVADARRFVRVTDERYDVIVGDLFHPYRDGAGALYTREHFAAIRERLATDGLFCQWLPLHQLDEPTLHVIVRTFLDVFPTAEAWLLRFNVDVPVMALAAKNGSFDYSANWTESRPTDSVLRDEWKRLGLADSVRLFGHFLAGSDELRAFANNAPLNTDQDQRVTFMAPRISYQKNAKPYATLLALLRSAKPEAFAMFTDDPQLGRRISAYIAARNVYLHGLIHDAENRNDKAVDAYIESARLNPDFTSGYAQCLSLATMISKSDPARAKRILERLIEAQPERPVAREMLERLFP